MKDIDELLQTFIEKGIDKKIAKTALLSSKYKRIIKADWHKMRDNKYEDIVDIAFCIKMYEEYDIPIYKLAMMYGTSDVTLRKYMIKYGVNLKGHMCGINSQNSYFKNIDTKDKAYFLGLIAADGAIVRNKTNGATLSIELIQTDTYILDIFNKYGKFNASFLIDTRHEKPTRRILINSCKIADDLSKYGLVQNKSALDSIFIPNLSDDLKWHFIRGYFDGDGIANDHGYIGFCGSKTIIHQIHDYIIEQLNITNTVITYNTSNHIYYIQWGKLKDTEKIYNSLYKDCDNLYLARKKDKISKRFSHTVQ